MFDTWVCKLEKKLYTLQYADDQIVVDKEDLPSMTQKLREEYATAGLMTNSLKPNT